MKLLAKLYIQVLIAMALAIVLGLIAPDIAVKMKPLGTAFIALLKMLLGPIIFFTVVHGVAHIGDFRRLGRIGIKTLIYFEVVTSLAMAVGFTVVSLVRPGDGLHARMGNELSAGQAATVNAAMSGGGFSLEHFFLSIIPKTLASAVGGFGSQTLVYLLRYILTYYASVLIFIFLALGSVAALAGFSIIKILRVIKEEAIVAMGTASSEAAFPKLVTKLTQAGCDEAVVGVRSAGRVQLQHRWGLFVHGLRLGISRPGDGYLLVFRAAVESARGNAPDVQGRCRRGGWSCDQAGCNP